ncbi:hypothetical protein Acsp02_95450 [Actinoplanes sp. NBRC 103695]|nr:hypothetical protein Acsp02_95450 [Actinoplanes sp. NBRC 103695]
MGTAQYDNVDDTNRGYDGNGTDSQNHADLSPEIIPPDGAPEIAGGAARALLDILLRAGEERDRNWIWR